jgi:ferredoxin--NADP+ reductase
MYKIVKKDILNPSVHRIAVHAPEVARAARPGQFIILRVDENGERVPLTVNDTDPVAGTVTVVFQLVGMTTRMLAQLEAGDHLQDFVGPLGNPSDLEGLSRSASSVEASDVPSHIPRPKRCTTPVPCRHYCGVPLGRSYYSRG